MSFWDIAKKMVQGKPVFETPNDHNAVYDKDLSPEDPGKRSIEQARRYDKNGNKILPRVEIIYCRCHKSGATMEVWATIKNQSAVNVYLDKVALCGSKLDFDYPLAPGQERQFKIFSGQRPNTDDYSYCDVFYRDGGTGDYFALTHLVSYRDDQDGTFSPLEFKPLAPRDV